MRCFAFACLFAAPLAVACASKPIGATGAAEPSSPLHAAASVASARAAARPLPEPILDARGADIVRAWGVRGAFVLYDVTAHRLTTTDLDTLSAALAHMDPVDEPTLREKIPTSIYRATKGVSAPNEWLVGSTEHGGHSYAFVLLLAAAGEPRSLDVREALARALLEEDGALPKTREGPIEIAITVDDLPVIGAMPKGDTRLAIHRRMIEAFAKHGATSVTGFVNGKGIDAGGRKGLEAWVAAGHPLGNHSFSHHSPFFVSTAAYLADIEKNESILAALSPTRPWKTYRFPFLQEGPDLAARAQVRTWLAAHGYQVAPVTIDFADYRWSAPFARCVAKKNAAAIAALERSFVETAKTSLQWSDGAARQILGRPIEHVLLLHGGAFQASQMDALLTAFEESNVKFVSLATALEDPALSVETDFAGATSNTLLEQIILTRKVPHPSLPQPPVAWLAQLCR
jgi:peptidoglycan-N-acetylglucosamine deacetylase